MNPWELLNIMIGWILVAVLVIGVIIGATLGIIGLVLQFQEVIATRRQPAPEPVEESTDGEPTGEPA